MGWLEDFWFGCGGCEGHGGCRFADRVPPDLRGSNAGLGGGAFVVSALAVFVLPILAAIAGADLAGRLSSTSGLGALGWWQGGGAAAGLACGAVLAKLSLGCLGWGDAARHEGDGRDRRDA